MTGSIMRATAAAACLVLMGAAPSEERTIAGDAIVAVRLNGGSVRLRIDPSAPGMPLIHRDVAQAAGLKMTGSWGFGVGYAIGDVTVMTRTQAVRLDWGGGDRKQRVGWSPKPYAAVADGSAGPGAIPEPLVRFVLRAPQPGERSVTLRAVTDTELFGLFSHFSAIFGEIDVAGAPLRIRLDPHHGRTLATAGAARRLALAFDGSVAGAAVPTEIFFGVERPVRTLTLGRPLVIGPLSIATLGVRATDHGSVAGLRDRDVPVDPDEVVVVAKGKKRDVRRDVVSLGADQLARCSSIVFDKRANVIRLSCR